MMFFKKAHNQGKTDKKKLFLKKRGKCSRSSETPPCGANHFYAIKLSKDSWIHAKYMEYNFLGHFDSARVSSFLWLFCLNANDQSYKVTLACLNKKLTSETKKGSAWSSFSSNESVVTDLFNGVVILSSFNSWSTMVLDQNRRENQNIHDISSSAKRIKVRKLEIATLLN